MIKHKSSYIYIAFLLLLSPLASSNAQASIAINDIISVVSVVSKYNDTIFSSETDSLINNQIAINNNDSIKRKRVYSSLTKPQKAGWLSAALPALGQAYNKKYWKIPIVWSGFAATGYLIAVNAKPMKQAKEALIWLNKPTGEAPNELALQYPAEEKLEAIYNQYRSNVELFALISIIWYAINIVDAVVDAHLSDFDVSDNISMTIKPDAIPVYSIENNNFWKDNYFSLNLCIKF